MQFGIDVPTLGPFADPSLLLELALETEACGWDGFFVWDDLTGEDGGPVADPWVVLSAVAARTRRIRFGPMVTPLARRRATKLARETVSLDHLSGGRLIMGVGLGERDQQDFAAFGDPGDRKVRGRILDESLAVLDGLWTGQPFEYEGEHLTVKRSTFAPPPLQRPRIPIWVAGLWPNKRPMRRAAVWDGAFPIDRGGDLSAMLSRDDMADAITFVKETRTADAPFDFVHAGLMSGDRAHDAQVARSYADIGVTWWLEHFYPGRLPVEAIRALIRGGPPRDS
jgi:alkanesulfonate monooxygenase SsuD/methylene tetrahydromethanopterin reductase-like flavin-dependent oxidoreductase (luciferase family)